MKRRDVLMRLVALLPLCAAPSIARPAATADLPLYAGGVTWLEGIGVPTAWTWTREKGELYTDLVFETGFESVEEATEALTPSLAQYMMNRSRDVMFRIANGGKIYPIGNGTYSHLKEVSRRIVDDRAHSRFVTVRGRGAVRIEFMFSALIHRA